jgi:hypothetical protein
MKLFEEQFMNICNCRKKKNSSEIIIREIIENVSENRKALISRCS